MILRCKTCTQRWKTFGQVTLTNWQSLLPLPLLKCLPLVGPGSATNNWINQLRQTASERFSEDKRVSFQAGDMLYRWRLKRSSAQRKLQNLAYFAHFLQRLICQINSFMGNYDVQIFDRLFKVEGTFSLLTERFTYTFNDRPKTESTARGGSAKTDDKHLSTFQPFMGFSEPFFKWISKSISSIQSNARW